ncbi:hypothetical protein ACC691_38600, partial [Rhizobium johnstonii]|uniref:hypothetical protein n=1 Tax=Rhizobium johnstonii TaxID=3019933 RepID=UPI003F94BB2E
NVGREAFLWYLRHVALVASEPEELVRAAEQDYRRAVAAEAAARAGFSGLAELPIAATAEAEAAAERELELQIREFSESHGLLSQPERLRHYR